MSRYAQEFCRGMCSWCGCQIPRFQGTTHNYPFFRHVTIIDNNYQVSAWQCNSCQHSTTPGISKGVFSWILLFFIALATILCILSAVRNQ